MTLKCNIQGTGASAEHSEAVCGELAPAVTAAGTNQATATLLKRLTRHSVTSGTGGVILPGTPRGDNLQYGDEIEITNASGSQINIYPPSGCNFYGAATNAAIVLPDGLSVSIIVYSATVFLARYYVGATGGGTGTVTSVGITAPTEITVGNSPITGSGDIGLTWTSQTQNKVFASPSSSTGTPAFRALVAGDLPNNGANPSAQVGPAAINGSATTWMRSDAAPRLADTAVTPGSYTYTNLTVDAQGRITAAASGSAPTGGTVTSVAMTGDGVVFNSSVTGSPVTTTGTLVPTLHTQTANTVFAGPTSGGAATPTFRAMVAADLVDNGANPTATAGASVVNGSATTWMRSDASPPVSANIRTTTIFYEIDGGGSAIATGLKGYMQINFDCTISANTLLADTSTTSVVNVWKCTYSAFDVSTHPVSGDKITASAPPTITAAVKSTDSTLTGWTTTITAGDILAFNVDSNNNATRLGLMLKVSKT